MKTDAEFRGHPRGSSAGVPADQTQRANRTEPNPAVSAPSGAPAWRAGACPMNPTHDPGLPGAGENPPASPNLEYWEGIIAQGLPNREAVALALLEIHSRKLYGEGYGSFQAYLRQRWHFSRARGYQLLHFARLKKRSTAVDTLGPQNERQARRLDAQGNGRRPAEDDPIMQAMEYVAAAFAISLNDRQ